MKKFMFIAILALVSASISSYGYTQTRTVSASWVNNHVGTYEFKSPIVIMSDFLLAWRKPSLSSSFTDRPYGWIGSNTGATLYGYYGKVAGTWNAAGELYCGSGTQMATGGEGLVANSSVAQTAFTLLW